MRVIENVAELKQGDEFYFVERGKMVGPFIVERVTGARTPEHIVGRNRRNGVLFEAYVPFTVWVEDADKHIKGGNQ